MLLLAVFSCVSFGNSKAFAQDVYMGNYVDGNEIWLMTETIQKEDARNFKTRVKSVLNGKLIRYIDYDFWGGVDQKGYVHGFKASDGRSGRINAQGLDEWSPVEHEILNYYNKVWSDYIMSQMPSKR